MEPSSDRDASCSICLEPFGADQQVCATVPCGHVFHSACFAGWERSRQGRANCKCPFCNTRTTTSIRLFVNFTRIDDDGSITSSEGDCESDEENGANDCLIAMNQSSGNLSEGPPNVIALRDNTEDCDLHDTIPRPLPKQSVKKGTPLSSTSDQVRRKAKRLKKRIKILEQQRQELINKEKDHLEQHDKFQDRFKRIDKEIDELRDEAKDVHRTLDHTRHQLERERLLRTRAQDSLALVEQRANLAERELQTIQSKHKKQLEDTQIKNMAEVRDMIQQHRDLVSDNHRLKEKLDKLNHEFERNKRHWGIHKGDNVDTIETVKSTRDVVKLWAAVKRSDIVKDEQQLASLECHTRTHVRMAPKMSGQAARMSLAAIQVAKQANVTSVPMDCVSSEHKMDSRGLSLSMGRIKRNRDTMQGMSSKSLPKVSLPPSSKPLKHEWGSLKRPSR